MQAKWEHLKTGKRIQTGGHESIEGPAWVLRLDRVLCVVECYVTRGCDLRIYGLRFEIEYTDDYKTQEASKRACVRFIKGYLKERPGDAVNVVDIERVLRHAKGFALTPDAIAKALSEIDVRYAETPLDQRVKAVQRQLVRGKNRVFCVTVCGAWVLKEGSDG